MYTKNAEKVQEKIKQARELLDNAIDICYEIPDMTGQDGALGNELIYLENRLGQLQAKIDLERL